MPEFFGRKYVLLDPALQPPVSERCAGNRAEMRERAEAMRESLDARGREKGPYSIDLAEPVGELGKLYADLCNHPAALEQYRLALQRLRISDGLLTPAQLPVLRALSRSYAAIGDYRSAQAALRSMFRVHSMGQEKLDAAALSDSLAYFSRARDIFIDPRSGGDLELLFEAYRDCLAMLETQIERGEMDYATYEALAMSHLANLYLMLGVDPYAASAMSLDSGSQAMDYLQRTQMITYSKGISVIEALLEASAGEPAVTSARLHFALGNWHQWNGKWRRACESYARAWEQAGDASESELRARLKQPAELPEDSALWASLLNPQIPEIAIIEADFQVSSRGDVSRVDARVVGEGSSGIAGRLGRWLRDSHVRPAVVDGACVDGELRGRRYRLLD